MPVVVHSWTSQPPALSAKQLSGLNSNQWANRQSVELTCWTVTSHTKQHFCAVKFVQKINWLSRLKIFRFDAHQSLLYSSLSCYIDTNFDNYYDYHYEFCNLGIRRYQVVPTRLVSQLNPMFVHKPVWWSFLSLCTTTHCLCLFLRVDLFLVVWQIEKRTKTLSMSLVLLTIIICSTRTHRARIFGLMNRD